MTYAEEFEAGDEFLPIGTKLLNGTYEITDHLGLGGFGLTYLAADQIGRRVVIKECFPSSFCYRDSIHVRAHTRSEQENFDALIKNFVNEAKQLARLKHPNVVPVLHFFEENDTAYMSLEYLPGRDLMGEIEDAPDRLTPKAVMEITRQLAAALAYVHQNGILHRDIAPDNVIMRGDTPILIDFGASRNETARKVTRMLSQQLRTVKDGYSPQEFYLPSTPHIPASDVYSLGATIYTLITHDTPADAYKRLVALSGKDADPVEPLAGRIPGYPVEFLQAIDAAMAVLPQNRPQSAEAFAELLLRVDASPKRVRPITADKSVHARMKREPAASEIIPEAPAKPRAKKGKGALVGTLGALIVAGAGGYAYLNLPSETAAPIQQNATARVDIAPTAAPTLPAPSVIEDAEVATAPVLEDVDPQPAAVAPVEAEQAEVAPVVEAEEPAPSEVTPAEPLTAVAAAPEVAAPKELAPASVDGWTVDLRLALNDTAKGITFAGGQDSPYPAGTLWTSVDGAELEGGPAEAPTRVATYFATSDPEGPRVPVSVENPFFGTTAEAFLTVDISRTLGFTAFEVVQSPEGDTWRLTIQNAGEGSGFQNGDVILSDRLSGQQLHRVSELSEILNRMRARGRPSAEFLVSRAGGSRSVSVDLADLTVGAPLN